MFKPIIKLSSVNTDDDITSSVKIDNIYSYDLMWFLINKLHVYYFMAIGDALAIIKLVYKVKMLIRLNIYPKVTN